MGDLISRSAIHNKICKHFNIPKDWDGDIAEPLQTVLDLIENEDCAYDVDKVVKEFKDLKEINQYHFECEKTFENLSDAEFHRGCVEILDEAIKITENSCSNADIYGAGYKLGYEDGYKIAIDDTQKHISALYKDCLNGTAGDDVLAWNKALDKVIEVIKAGGKEA